MFENKHKKRLGKADVETVEIKPSMYNLLFLKEHQAGIWWKIKN